MSLTDYPVKTGKERVCITFIRTIPLLMYDDHKPEDIDTKMEDHVADEVRYMCMANPMKPLKVQERKPEVYNSLDDDEPKRDRYLLASDLPQWKVNEYLVLWKQNQGKPKNNGYTSIADLNAESNGSGNKPLSAAGQRQLSALSSMYGSMSNQYKDEDGDYPVEKSIVQLVRDGKIEPDDGVILMRKFGYDPDKWFD